MTEEQWNVVDFIVFESETSVIYPFSTEFKNVTMEMIDNIIELCNDYTGGDTDILYNNCSKILGINPKLIQNKEK